ncbi:MAG TPA: Ltp family lipoprotein [Candidatus Limnocylindrales bacterium]|nr:Ltp family lipoprotein [Candidatus Limnocylindrales bacterium]
MKKCKSCQTEIDLKASKCPHCKSDQRGWFRRHPILTGVLGLFVFFVLIGATGSGNESSNSTATNSSTEDSTSNKTEQVETSENKEPDVPAEYRSALNKATTYANNMNMSKKGVYDQLVSDYGEKFSPEAAQYAIDNVKADWNANALAKAKSYQNDQNMSSASIRSQLISEYGEKFTEAEADYAIANLNK